MFDKRSLINIQFFGRTDTKFYLFSSIYLWSYKFYSIPDSQNPIWTCIWDQEEETFFTFSTLPDYDLSKVSSNFVLLRNLKEVVLLQNFYGLNYYI